MSLNNQPFSYLFPNGIRCGGSSSFEVATFSGTVVMSSTLTVGSTITAGGRVTTGASTTGAASLNIPPGTAPTSPNNGDVWTTTGGAYAQIDGVTYPLAGSSIMGRNMVINGDLSVDERKQGNTSTSVTGTTVRCADRWAMYSIGTGVFTCQRQSSSPPTSFNYYLRFTVTTADSSIAANDVYMFSTKIEGLSAVDLAWGSSSAKTITLSFWVRSSMTGTFPVRLANWGYTRGIHKLYTINVANTWEKKTITFPGDTGGSWNTGPAQFFDMSFSLGTGSNYEGTADTWGSVLVATSACTEWISTLGATFDITGVQIERGAVASPFEYRPYQIESKLCERYFERQDHGGLYGWQACASDTWRNWWAPWRTPKGGTPTMAFTGGGFTPNNSSSNVYMWCCNYNFGNTTTSYYITSVTGEWEI